MKLLKNKFFLTGFLFLFFLLALSILNHFLFGSKIISARNDQITRLPLRPSLAHPLGTDTTGKDMLHIIIYGAKYTILIGLTITILRAGLGIVIGISLSYTKMMKETLLSFGEAFHFIPGTLITFFIMVSVVSMTFHGFDYSLPTQIAFQVVIMTLIALPSVAMTVSRETDLIKQKDYYKASEMLGAGKLFLIRKHIFPLLKYNFLILTGQQFINVLIILVHLGVLKVFLGGTWIDYSPMHFPPHSVSWEWSGLIGQKLSLLMIYPWIPFAPILFFTLSILAIQLMIIGIKRTEEEVSC